MSFYKVKLNNLFKHLLNETAFLAFRKYYLKMFESHKNLSHIFIELSSRCNLDCTFCSLRENFKEKGTMALKTFYSLENAFQKLKSVSFHCNGEPLMNGEIIKMLSFSRNKNSHMNISFSTNGLLLTPELSLALLENGLDGISFSMDGSKKETYENMRKGSNFEKFLKTVSEFIELKKKTRNRLKKIGITVVASKQNLHELSDILEFAHRLGANYFKVNGIVPHNPGFADQILYCNQDQAVNSEFQEVFKDLEAKARKFQMTIVLPSLKFRPFNHCELNSCLINWNGEVSPCFLLSYKRPYYFFGHSFTYEKIVFGNILNSKIHDIWNSKEFLSFRRNLSSGRILTSCKNCFLQGGVL